MTLRELQEMYDLAKIAYKEGIRTKIQETINESLKPIAINTTNWTYEASLLTEEEAMNVSDEDFDKNEEKELIVRDILQNCKNELYYLIEEIDEYCSVSISLYNDTSIGIEIKGDKFEFEYEIKNRYNK